MSTTYSVSSKEDQAVCYFCSWCGNPASRRKSVGDRGMIPKGLTPPDPLATAPSGGCETFSIQETSVPVGCVAMYGFGSVRVSESLLSLDVGPLPRSPWEQSARHLSG